MKKILFLGVINNLFKYKCLYCKNDWKQDVKSNYNFCPYCGIEFLAEQENKKLAREKINNNKLVNIKHPINVILIESKSENDKDWVVRRTCDPYVDPKIILSWFKELREKCNTKDAPCQMRIRSEKFNYEKHNFFMWRD